VLKDVTYVQRGLLIAEQKRNVAASLEICNFKKKTANINLRKNYKRNSQSVHNLGKKEKDQTCHTIFV